MFWNTLEYLQHENITDHSLMKKSLRKVSVGRGRRHAHGPTEAPRKEGRS